MILDIAWQVGFDAGKVISVIPATHEEMDLLSISPFFQTIKGRVFQLEPPIFVLRQIGDYRELIEINMDQAEEGYRMAEQFL